jgi:hypothetical protein
MYLGLDLMQVAKNDRHSDVYTYMIHKPVFPYEVRRVGQMNSLTFPSASE